MNIDLHIHTSKSDGILTPKEVIDEAMKNNVNVISICDHDTIEAYTDSLLEYAKKNNIKLIYGVEISTKYKGYGYHVLGYNIDIFNKDLKEELSKIRLARHNYLYEVSKKLNELGYIVNTNELDKIDLVTKAHIANDIINNEKNKDLLIKKFNKIPNKGEFIETLLNENCPCYVEKLSITPYVASCMIKKYGGKVILAHPVAYYYEDKKTIEDITNLLKEMNADGIEGNYIYIDKNNIKHNDIDIWNNLANKLNIVSTIGSDFHNFDNIHPVIGLINEDIKIDKNDIINKLLNEK
mgnify:FL=1